MAINHRSLIRRKRSRSGATLVEFALIAPILFVFFVSCIEFSRINMIRNSMSSAAYEGARKGIIPGSTSAQVEATARASLSATGIVPESVVVTPTIITQTTPTVTVTITVLGSNNLWIAPMFTKGISITKSSTLSREKTTSN